MGGLKARFQRHQPDCIESTQQVLQAAGEYLIGVIDGQPFDITHEVIWEIAEQWKTGTGYGDERKKAS